MFELSSFYKTKQWESLIAQIKIERVNEEGELLCEMCGKPISKAYDAICHHVIPLTEENVNDFNISLNPSNIQILHHKCHNITHDKLGHSERQVFIVYGAPFSGKHDWVMENKDDGDLILEMDSLWMALTGAPRYIHPNRMKSVVFKARDTILEAVKYRLGKWTNAYVIGGYPLVSERERIIKELGAREVFIDSPREICIYNLYSYSEAGEPIDVKEYEGFIDEWFARYSPPVG